MKLLKSSFWLHSIFYTLLQRFSLFFFGAVSYMVLVRGLSKESNAIWALYLTILTLFETIKQGLLRNPTIKFLGQAEYADKKPAVQSASLVINLVFSALALAVLLPGAGFIAHLLKSPDLLPLLLWSAVFIVVLIPYNHYEILLQARYLFPKIFWAYFLRQAIFFSGIVILHFFLPAQFTLMNLLLLQVLSLLAGTIMLYIAARPFLLKQFQYNGAIIVQMFHFGKYIFGTNLFSNVTRSFDHFVTANTLNAIEGKNYVAYYNTVARINNMMDVPSLAAADVLFPKNVETVELHGLEKVKYYFERMVGTILSIIVPLSLFIFLFPKLIIYVLAGTQYYGAIPILQITILFSLIRALGYQFGSTLDAIGKPVVNFWSSALMMVIALGTNYFCLKQFGGMGAAYATLINAVVGFCIMYVVLRKYIRLEIKNIVRYMFMTWQQVFTIVRKVRKFV